VLIRDGALRRPSENLFQGGKFLRRKPHPTTGKAWFWFQFCHTINMTEDLSQSTRDVPKIKMPWLDGGNQGNGKKQAWKWDAGLQMLTNGIFKTTM
jgi:hypothetical protein